MRIGYRKSLGGGFYVSSGINIGGKRHKSSSASTKGLASALAFIFVLPFYLMYYVCIWPFIKLFQALYKERKKKVIVSTETATQYLQIINDCSNLVQTTKDPEVFFSRYDLLLEVLEKLSEMEGYISLKGEKPSVKLQRLSSLREQATNEFIDRYAKDTRIKLYELSTERGKRNRADAFLNILNEYQDKMTNYNIEHYTTTYQEMQKRFLTAR